MTEFATHPGYFYWYLTRLKARSKFAPIINGILLRMSFRVRYKASDLKDKNQRGKNI